MVGHDDGQQKFPRQSCRHTLHMHSTLTNKYVRTVRITVQLTELKHEQLIETRDVQRATKMQCVCEE